MGVGSSLAGAVEEVFCYFFSSDNALVEKLLEFGGVEVVSGDGDGVVWFLLFPLPLLFEPDEGADAFDGDTF